MILDMLKSLHKEFATLIISFVLAILIIFVSNSWWQTAYDEKSLAEVNLRTAKDRYYTGINQKKLLAQFEDRYQHLEHSGIVGNENRLNWVDTLEKVTTRHKIPYLKYNIEQRQTVVSSQLTKQFPGIDLFKSTMTLQMQLLHEGDLYTIINSLHHDAKGLFDIKSCAIVRNTTQAESLLDSATNKNFSAKCKLNWYTMQKKSPRLPTKRRS